MNADDFLDGLHMPEEIARRISESSGVRISARTARDTADDIMTAVWSQHIIVQSA